MTRPYGMTITQFNDILKDMRKCYAFDNDETHITNMLDMKSDTIRCLEVTTIDAKTGVAITMQKGCDLN